MGEGDCLVGVGPSGKRNAYFAAVGREPQCQALRSAVTAQNDRDDRAESEKLDAPEIYAVGV